MWRRICTNADHDQIVDFLIWKLFRTSTGPFAPSHMLCRGYQKYLSTSKTDESLAAVAGVPGVFRNTTNPHVEGLKKEPWCALPSLLGAGGERILADLFLHCGLFERIGISSNLNQICGVPLSDLAQVDKTITRPIPEANYGPRLDQAILAKRAARPLSDIRFVRYRMLHAGPDLTAKGFIRFGLPQNHMLNKVRHIDKNFEAEDLLRYIFSPAVWATQCLHIRNRSQRHIATIQGLRRPRTGNRPLVV